MERERNELILKKRKADKDGDEHAYADCCFELAKFCSKHKMYADALVEYRLAAMTYEKFKGTNYRLKWIKCNGRIGELLLSLSRFDDALYNIQIYLAESQKINNIVEEQNALKNLGIIYMYKGQNISNKEKAKRFLTEAESAFNKSLILCERLLDGRKYVRKLMKTQALLHLNLGVVQQHFNELDKALLNITKAIKICNDHQLYEILQNCYHEKALIHSSKDNKENAYFKAMSCMDDAFIAAAMLPNKDVRKCVTMSCQANVMCRMSDYSGAKHVLSEAIKIKCSDNVLNKALERKLESGELQRKRQLEKSAMQFQKPITEMCEKEDELEFTDPSNHVALKDLYKKLGDGAIILQNYTDASKYYHKMLKNARLLQKQTGENEKTLAPIYSSLYKTYRALEQYDLAVKYKRDEYLLIKDNPQDAFNALYQITECQYLAKKPYHLLEKVCSEARKVAEKINDNKLMIKILKRLLMYQKHYEQTNEIVEIENKLRALGYDKFDDLDDSDDDSPTKNSFVDTCFGRDYMHLGSLTDGNNEPSSSKQEAQNNGKENEPKTVRKHKKKVSENASKATSDTEINLQSDLSNSDEEEASSHLRRRNSGYNIKKNQWGESQLQQACRRGHKDKVLELISEGHPIDVRDHYGWTPLHEACVKGHTEIAQILINKGADINNSDNNDHLTPLQKAAERGNLAVMELLLENGAIAFVRTPSEETALDILAEWRNDNDLLDDKVVLYNRIYNKLKNLIKAKTPQKLKTNPNTPVKLGDSNQPNNTKDINRNIFGSDSSNNNRVTRRSSALGETENPVKDSVTVLRNGRLKSTSNESKSKQSLTRKESDLVQNKTEMTKKKKINDADQSSSKENNEKLTVAAVENDITNNRIKSRRLGDKSPTATPMECSPKKGRTMKMSSVKASPIKKQSARKSTTKCVSKIQIQQAPAASLKRIKVHVEDESFWIPVNMDAIDELKISWLVEEAKFRYYKETGNRVDLSLIVDGAKISEDDPLSLVHTCTEFKTFITNRNTTNVDDVLGENNDVTMRDASNNVDAVPMPSTSRAEPIPSSSRTQSKEPIASTSGAESSTSKAETNNNNVPEDNNHAKTKITETFIDAVSNATLDENFNIFCEQVKFLIELYLK